MVLLAGQISGIVFIVAMNALGMIRALFAFVALAILNVVVALLLRESPRIVSGGKEA